MRSIALSLLIIFGQAFTLGAQERIDRAMVAKIRAEGEAQEMIDICDFASGLSRQLYGLTIASERRDHRMMEQWHPWAWWGSSARCTRSTAFWIGATCN